MMASRPDAAAGPSSRRRFGLLAALAVLVLAGAGQAQVPDRDSYDDPISQSSRPPALSQQAYGANAAATQVAAPAATERYRPDQIEGDAQRSSTRAKPTFAGDQADERRGAGERLTGPRRPRAPSEFEEYASKIVDKPLRRFGESLLVPSARDFTTPPTTTVPPDYLLNPGDELVVGLTGSVEAADLHVTVDSEGRVFIPKVGAVALGGVRYGDVQAVLARQVARVYRDFKVAVSIGRLHGITVYVTGFAERPGSYSISSLSTLVNAVLSAGGPSAGGSFRSIQVRRSGQLVADFDLYDLLLKGDKRGDVVLQNADVIYIAPAGAQIAVIGSVNNEAIYEAARHDHLDAVLAYAGGVNTVADDSRLLLLDALRSDNGGWEQLTPADLPSRAAKRGEVLRVLSGVGMARPLQQQAVLVTVSGEVAKPGRYYVPPGTVLGDVIIQAGGLTTNAYPFATVFTRDSVRETQRQSYEQALRDIELTLSVQPVTTKATASGQAPPSEQAIRSIVDQLEKRRPDGRVVLDIAATAQTLPGGLRLENNDTVYIPPPPTTVGVFGSVPSPSSFEYRPHTTLRTYLQRAGGVQRIGDADEIFVVRANGTLLSPDHRLFGHGALDQPALPGDLIFVPIAGMRESIWAKLAVLSSLLFQTAILAASVSTISQ